MERSLLRGVELGVNHSLPFCAGGLGGPGGGGRGGAGLGGGSQCVVAEAVTSSRVLEDTFHVIIKAKIKDILKPTLKL